MELEKDLAFFIELDPFVKNTSQKKYFVRSLYFDDPVYSAFYDKVDGLLVRSKFRLRTYNHDVNSLTAIFLEIKGRENGVVFKHRTPVSLDGIDWASLSGDEIGKAVLKNSEASKVLDQFHFELFKKRLTPVALIDYSRRPYYSKYDHNFRVTFDEGLKGTRTSKIFPANDFPSRNILSGHTILEVKFSHQIPSWFHKIIQTHELRRVSISKICAGMETLGIASDD
jgi:hypothetical protein